jgi:hypothetical protein
MDAIGVAKSTNLLQIYIFKPSKFVQDAVCGHIEIFVVVDKVAWKGEARAKSRGYLTSVNEQHGKLFEVKAKNDAVYGYVRIEF